MKKLKKILLGTAIILVCGFILLVVDDYLEISSPGLVVLLYHDVVKHEKIYSKYQVKADDFEKQMDYLEKNGYQTLLPRELIEIRGNTDYSKTVMLSFDDGAKSHYKYVFPALEKRKMKGVFFIIAKYINKPWSLTDKQLIEMIQHKMEIGSHSYSHPMLDIEKDNIIQNELKESKDIISKVINEEVISFAPPGGWYDDRVVRIAKIVGYKYFFGCEIGTNNMAKKPYIFKRIEVTGDMSLDEFKDLLTPKKILPYKISQSIKFMLHDLIGSKYYSKFAQTIK